MKSNFHKRKSGYNLSRFLWVFVFCALLSFQAFAQYPAGSPVAINGKLKVAGNKMVNECNNPVQLRGMSSHGPQWFGNCYTDASLDAMVNNWGIDIFRIAMYVEEGGYVNNPSYWKNWIDGMVAKCAQRGIYCLIDWHVLNPGDPWANMGAARDFWSYMSQKHKGEKHVLYEITNEPNGVDWPRVKSYAQDIIPRIRANDPNSIIIVGTPTWSQDVDTAANSPLNYSNIMYTLHFYSGTHTAWLRNKADVALSKGIALFVTEFGTSQASGDGGPYLQETQAWMNWMATNKISWINWSFADKSEVSAALSPGACGSSKWNSTSTSGTFIKDHLLNPRDNFVCNGGGGTTQSPYAGVINLPGTIEAENFDKGGQGVAYNDTGSANNGGKYRTSEGVDIQSCSEGGYNVGWTSQGEWMEYTVKVANTGSYRIDARVSSPSGGKFHIDFGSNNVTGATGVPNTGGWQNWQTVSKTVNLNAGQQIVKFVVDQGGFNFNKITISSAANNQSPTDISLSSTEVNENQPVGTVVGTFSTTDPDQNNTFTYTLELAGTNNDKNSFTIDGNKLKTKAVFNYATKSNYRIKVRSTDQGGLYDEKWFDYIKVIKSGGGIVSGQVYRLVARHSGKVLDVSGCSGSDGANVQQWPWDGANCQKWKVEATNNGYYKLTSQQSGKALDVNGCSSSDGANVQQWPYWGGDCQQWKIESTDSGYFRLLARNSGKALDVSGCSGSNGANVQIWPYNGGSCQQWKLEAVASGKSTELSGKIEHASETSMVVYNGSAEGIINLQLNLPKLGNYNLRIYSLLGRVVYKETLNVNENKFIKELDLTQFQKGIYILKFEYGNQIMTKKIIL